MSVKLFSKNHKNKSMIIAVCPIVFNIDVNNYKIVCTDLKNLTTYKDFDFNLLK